MKQTNNWEPELHEELEGILIEKLDNMGIYHNKLYKIQKGNEIINVWGKKQLDSIMETARIGDKIILRYVGVKPVNEYEMKLYELEILNE